MCYSKKTRLLFCLGILIIGLSFRQGKTNSSYAAYYLENLKTFSTQQEALIRLVSQSNLTDTTQLQSIKQALQQNRNQFKKLDFWLRYFEPLAHKKINGPLPVEWETEVFEKFENPYKRIGAGYTLAFQQLEEEDVNKDTLLWLLSESLDATQTYSADSILKLTETCDPFFLSNRLFLLNAATIYTTGFDCPDTSQIIPELVVLMESVNQIYLHYNQTFPNTPLPHSYLVRYQEALHFAKQQPQHYSQFDHYTFVREFINPLFQLNQELIRTYHVTSRSMLDYSLNKQASSIFSKSLYNGQYAKGIFGRVQDSVTLHKIDQLGKLLFYDPILSGNNQRSCASCHNPQQYFTDTAVSTALQFNAPNRLPRNTPSLINAPFQHLIMADGLHPTLLAQTKGVIQSPIEMNASTQDVVQKIMSCKQYARAFTELLAFTPQEQEVTIDHVASVITYYYSKFSRYDAPFDDAMNRKTTASIDVQKGYNLFMSKAQCATCHFAPQFNGVKPPYIGSEFEVLGTPSDSLYRMLSTDKGRYGVNPASETANAFRTSTVRNTVYTKPYMHNGAFFSLEEVLNFYDGGGGNGHGLAVPNQTLSSDSLHLTQQEKNYLLAFINSLNESIPFEKKPKKLPTSSSSFLNHRTVGGTY